MRAAPIGRGGDGGALGKLVKVKYGQIAFRLILSYVKHLPQVTHTFLTSSGSHDHSQWASNKSL